MDTECLTVLVERITYTNPQSGYSVLRTSSRGHPQGVTVVGTFVQINPGEELRVYGTWTCHPQFGMQFQAFRYSTLKPATLKGIEKYLGSGLIKGIGPVTAKRLVEAFGVETLEVIEKDPERLSTCPGIGPVRSEKITAGWVQQKAIQDVMIFLQGHGISPAYAVRIFKQFGNDSVKKVADNPYLLAYEIHGIGFKTADKIAAEFGITGADPRRLSAGVLYLLQTALDEGHLFLETSVLLAQAEEILEVKDREGLQQAVASQLDQKRLVRREWEGRELLYLPFAYRDEQGAVEALAGFLTHRRPVPRDRLLWALETAVKNGGVSLSERQSLAVETSLQERFLIVTGGPGTGKTTTLRALVEAHSLLGRTVLLASPTGRAAKRLAEVTGRDAQTVHRLLEFSPTENRFKRDRQNPLDCQTLVLDEASMLDMWMFHSVVKAIPPDGTLILVGDADQLPSVGPGLVLRHLLDSGVLPIVRLDTIFRQAESSMIIANAHRINRGQMPILQEPDGKTQTDCYFLEAADPEKALGLLKNVIGSSLPKRFGYHPIEDIQVLTPMNRGSLGAVNLNQVLQEVLNPGQPEKAELAHLHRVFRVGDKVIQLRNNYDLEVFNGDTGIVRGVESEDQELVVEFPQGEKVFQANDLLDLSHAFAVTVHKSQGSEYPAVVLLLTTQHYVLLQRNLLYTGSTRARRTLVLLGSKRAIAMAVKNAKVQERNSLLCELLQQKLGGSPTAHANSR